jgi:hypothetical protein
LQRNQKKIIRIFGENRKFGNGFLNSASFIVSILPFQVLFIGTPVTVFAFSSKFIQKSILEEKKFGRVCYPPKKSRVCEKVLVFSKVLHAKKLKISKTDIFPQPFAATIFLST